MPLKRDEPWLFLDESQEEIGIKKKATDSQLDLAVVVEPTLPSAYPYLQSTLYRTPGPLRPQSSSGGSGTGYSIPTHTPAAYPSPLTRSSVSVPLFVAAFAVKNIENYFRSTGWPLIDGCPLPLQDQETDPKSATFNPKAVWIRYCRYLEHTINHAAPTPNPADSSAHLRSSPANPNPSIRVTVLDNAVAGMNIQAVSAAPASSSGVGVGRGEASVMISGDARGVQSALKSVRKSEEHYLQVRIGVWRRLRLRVA